MGCRGAHPFNLERPFSISLVGGGGKTTTMYLLSRRWGVLSSTTTKVFVPERGEVDVLLLQGRDRVSPEVIKELLDSGKRVLLGSDIEGSKVVGVSGDTIDALKRGGISSVVEADGAKGYSIKVHRKGEPVIPRSTDLVLMVVGMDVLGKRAGVDTVFRFELGLEKGLFKGGEVVDVDFLLRLFYGPGGYISSMGGPFRYAFFFNKVDTVSISQVFKLADAVLSEDRDVYGVYYGSAMKGVIEKYGG